MQNVYLEQVQQMLIVSYVGNTSWWKSLIKLICSAISSSLYNLSSSTISQLLLATLVGATDAVLFPHHDSSMSAGHTAAPVRSRLKLEQVRQAAGALRVGIGLLVEGRAEKLAACQGGTTRPAAVDRCQLNSCSSCTCRPLQQVERHAIVIHLPPCEQKH